MLRPIVCAALALLLAWPASAQLAATAGGAAQPKSAPTLPTGFYLEDAVDATFNLPVTAAFAPGGRMFVVEKAGIVRVVQNGVLQPEPFIDLRDEVYDQHDRGLLGIAIDPNFENNRRVYLSYTVDDPLRNGSQLAVFSRVTRYTGSASNPNVAVASSRRVLIGETFATGIPSCYRSHAIGTLHFGSDGSLLVGSGDGASFNRVDPGGQYPECFQPGALPQSEDIGSFRSQRVESLAGKVLRINPNNGRGYSSNPFYTGDTTDNASKVWVLGLRNPYRFAIDTSSGATSTGAGNPGRLYIGDVGWTLWEDLHVADGGENFGWPCYEGPAPHAGYQAARPATNGCNTPLAGTLRLPEYTWHHSNASLSQPTGRTGRAIVGGAVYDGTKYPAYYQGALFYGDYSRGWIGTSQLDASGDPTQERLFATGAGPVVGYAYDPASEYMHLVDVFAGRIQRIRYDGESANAPPVAQAAATPTEGGQNLRVQFSSAGSFDPDGDGLTYVWTFGDGAQSTDRSPVHAYPTPGVYEAELALSDGVNVDRKTIAVTVRTGSAPTIAITAPQATDRPAVGQAFTLRASVSDPDQSNGSLFVRWTVTQVHDNHVHPDVFTGSGTTAVFTPAEHGATGETVYYRILAEVRDATGLVSTDETTLFLAGAEGETDVTAAGTPIAQVAQPQPGRGSTDIEVIRDGVTPDPGDGRTALQFATYNGSLGVNETDWVGYSFPAPQRFTRLDFVEGVHAADGGWFETTPRVQVRENGTWRDVVGLNVSPAYRADDGRSFDRYALVFAPITGDAIRLYGPPGGSGAFISVGELRAWALDAGGGSGSLPAPWSSNDIGDPSGAGSASESGGTFSVTGGGDIWNEADRFHFAHQPMAGDGVLIARVASVSPTPDWAKAGIMIRSSLDPGAPYASVVLSNVGVHVQARQATGGASQGPADDFGRSGPVWLRLTRSGPNVEAATSADGVSWTPLSTVSVAALGTGPVFAGLAVSAADFGSGRTATGVFTDVSLSSDLPAGWTSADIGGPSGAGSASESNGSFSITGGGDIWNEADRFHYAWWSLPAAGALVARVPTPAAAADWAKAGLMVRRSTSPGAAHATILLSRIGLHLQYRAQSGGSTAGPADYYGRTGPQWLRLERSGTTVAAFESADGGSWSPITSVNVPGLGSGAVLIGLAVSAADFGSGATASATFQNVSVIGAASAGGEELEMDTQSLKTVGFGIDAIFPNPARTRAAVRAMLPDDAAFTLTVVDVLGRQILREELQGGAGVIDVALDLADQPAGRYLVRLRNDATGEAETRILTVVR